MIALLKADIVQIRVYLTINTLGYLLAENSRGGWQGLLREGRVFRKITRATLFPPSRYLSLRRLLSQLDKGAEPAQTGISLDSDRLSSGQQGSTPRCSTAKISSLITVALKPQLKLGGSG